MELLAAAVSLGCAKNLVDSELMVAQLVPLGYRMTSDPSSASLILVNTCGFLESAVEEGIESILSLATQKTVGSCKCLVVAGCMVQRYGKKLVNLLPEVDLFLGTSHYHKLAEALLHWQKVKARKILISSPRHLFDSKAGRVLSTPSPSTYLKIAEGCSNRCAFCMIPHLRGPYRSRTPEDVVKEASSLVEQGVREINLVAQDTTAFGFDRGDRYALIRLLESLDEMSGLEWIRLLYAYPEHVGDDLLRTMAQARKVVPYLDIPFQHCVPRILEAMGRRAPSQESEKLVGRIRSHMPDVALRTSLMVGFPGETESDFEALVHFVKSVQFDHLGVFAFSPEAGTPAGRMPFQIDTARKEQRRTLLLDLQRDISRRLLEKRVGELVLVLVEGFHPETELLLTGRMATQAPEVDGAVIITRGLAEPGQLMLARISAAHEYDVEAELLPSSSRNRLSVARSGGNSAM